MANNLNGIFETLVVPAATASAQCAKFANPMLEYCFTDYRGLHGQVGNTLEINIPIVNEADVTDIGSGPIVLTDANHTPTSITINHNQSDSKRIQAFDRMRTPLDLQRLYLDAMIESVLRKINRSVANLANPAGGTGFLLTNTAITGATAAEFTRANVAAAWEVLVGQGAPMDPANAFFVTNHVPYGNMLADVANNWIQQFVVGQPAAEKLQQSARFMPQYNMSIDYDQTFPSNVTPKYLALAFHRYAIGLLPVIQPPVDTAGYVREITVFPRKDFPVRVQLWYDPTNQGYVLHVNSVYGLAVVRPEWGVQVIAG